MMRRHVRGNIVATAQSVDDYMAALSEPARTVMEGLRKTIRAAAPDALELSSYQMPAFKTHGQFLVSYAAFKKHISLFPASEAVITELGDDLAPYLAGKATIQFTTENPLSVDVVTRIVKVRLAENAARGQR
jgi:uncharacterized protein YdhG (YjbR/CyaY superfamily)